MKIAIGSDHAGFDSKKIISELLKSKGYEVVDFGAYSPESVDYPDIAFELAKSIVSKKENLGILICGTGVGISISANKVKGIRCALANDIFTAAQSKKHNNANILAMGARIIDVEKMKEIVITFLTTEFEGGRHQLRIDKMMNIEKFI